MEEEGWNSESDSTSVGNNCQVLEPQMKRPRTLQGLKNHNVGGVERKIDQKVVHEFIAQMVTEHDLPCEFVEWNGFQALTKYISSDQAQCVSNSRDYVAADVMRVYLLEKQKLKRELASVRGRLCLTFRHWTSEAAHGYFTLTAHYVDEDWKLNAKLLNFGHMAPPHSDFELSRKLDRYLCGWGIERKIFSITVDNASASASASSNDELQNSKERPCYWDGVLSDGEFFHFKCGAHILDLIAQESLKVVSDFTHKIRKSVKYVSVSFTRLKQFYQYVEEVGGIDTKDGLHLDVSGKWNSTYRMLESAIKFRRAFECLRSDMKYKHCPTNEEWERGEKICKFLKAFYELSSRSYGSTCRTINLYLYRILWIIELSLRKMKLREDRVIKDMAGKMLDEFEKYLSEYSMILAFAFALDPSRKLKYLEDAYYRLYGDINVAKDKVNNVRKALSALFKEYANKGASTSSNLDSRVTIRKSGSTMSDPLMDSWIEHCEREIQKKYDAGMTQLDLYFEEIPSDYGYKTALDYWKNRSHQYVDVALMARDVLSFPIFAVASESAFSIGSSILNKYRSCMLSENLQALICSHNWLYGFSHTDQFGDMMEGTKRIEINLSKLDSNVIVKYESEDED
ncbi:zinc finger BED domain-containing protein RICESLEEPER 3-like [Lotus japonicus]|uniref:zinc finger BED domain-containing protein RICESLEEPER 3-like n=1 Tax=Lotus japonicus TaxID=34305 RepID=UPI00258A9DC6|nr:zinc finger BED domain-containing protein RICESLEEPER 3-like [Lotus japonicus]XP_057414984.1 zinc finger BED domain-containing protein RICESLEEPER 3-like [Lotus japonicus]